MDPGGTAARVPRAAALVAVGTRPTFPYRRTACPSGIRRLGAPPRLRFFPTPRSRTSRLRRTPLCPATTLLARDLATLLLMEVLGCRLAGSGCCSRAFSDLTHPLRDGAVVTLGIPKAVNAPLSANQGSQRGRVSGVGTVLPIDRANHPTTTYEKRLVNHEDRTETTGLKHSNAGLPRRAKISPTCARKTADYAPC
jgi:hypothetical protein